jgi:hypothetical protein
VVAQAAGVHRRWDEAVAERVHRHQRCQADGVAVVVRVDAAGQRRARRRLGRDVADRILTAQRPAHEREHEAAEVRPAAHAADDHVRQADARELELRDRLLPDHRLVQQDVVQDGAERVIGVLVGRGDLHRLGDRDAQ